MNFLYILAALLILGIIVIAHEFGHYIVGRLCGIGVVEFAVGFGPKIVGFKRKGIQYSIRCIPLGGFCKFVGEDADNPDPRAMNNQPVWKRFLTVAAGPFMNFVFALILAVILLACYGVKSALPYIDSVVDSSPAQTCGIQAGDVITEINGEKIEYSQSGVEKAREIIQNNTIAEKMNITVRRGENEVKLNLTPEIVETDGAKAMQIGVYFGYEKYSIFDSIKGSFEYTWDFMVEMVKSLKNLIFRGEGFSDAMGPVGIISFVSQQVREGMYMAIMLTFINSLNLGIINLLPLPALDGGRLVFLIVEMVRRKPIPPEKEGMVHAAGFVILLIIIGVFTYQDIARLITGG